MRIVCYLRRCIYLVVFGVCSLFVVGSQLSHVCVLLFFFLFFVVWRALFVCLSVVVWWLLFVCVPLVKCLFFFVCWCIGMFALVSLRV